MLPLGCYFQEFLSIASWHIYTSFTFKLHIISSNNCLLLVSTYYVLDKVPRSLNILTHLIVSTLPCQVLLSSFYRCGNLGREVKQLGQTVRNGGIKVLT